MDRTQVAALVLGPTPTRTAKQTRTPADPLAPIAGRSVLGWVVDAAIGASIRRIAIVGNEPGIGVRTEIARRTDNALIDIVTPDGLDGVDTIAVAIERLGGDLVLSDNSHLLLLSGSAPQIDSSELRALISDHVSSGASATLLGSPANGSESQTTEPSVTVDDVGNVTSILEPLTSWSDEIASIAVVRASLLAPALRRVTPRGWRSQPLIVDAVEALRAAGHQVHDVPREEPVWQISSNAGRAPIEMELRDRIVDTWIERGVSIPDPRQVAIDAAVTLGQGVQILPGTVLQGTTEVGDGAVLGPNSQIIDASIGAGVRAAHVVVQHTEVPAHARLKPFSVLGSPPMSETV